MKNQKKKLPDDLTNYNVAKKSRPVQFKSVCQRQSNLEEFGGITSNEGICDRVETLKKREKKPAGMLKVSILLEGCILLKCTSWFLSCREIVVDICEIYKGRHKFHFLHF